jgi:hypothetical protein
VVNRFTQTPEYWSNYTFSAEDAETVSSYLLEANSSKSSSAIAREIMRQRIEKENAIIRAEMERGRIYQPKRSFEIGEEVMFPAQSFARGKVISKRAGANEGLGKFEVMTVEMSGGYMRDYAINYEAAHALNDDAQLTALLNQQNEVKSPEQIFEEQGAQVVSIVEANLETNEDYLKIGNDWFMRSMMADVNDGHLNLAEAVLEVAGGGPLPTHIILRDLALPPDVARSLQEASLNAAMASDDRFIEVSLNDKPAWFLRRLEPADIQEVPIVLRGVARHPQVTNALLSELATQIDDELEFELNSPIERSDKATVILVSAHRRAGTMPLNHHVAAVMPDSSKTHLPVFFQDQQNGKKYTVWLAHDKHYISGLADWYKANDLPAGAVIEISRTAAENTFAIDCKRHKPKREWVRVATARENRLRLETAQRQVLTDADDLMSVYADEMPMLTALREAFAQREISQIVRDIFPEIAKLSPQGNVHARMLYAVANLLVRVAPRDVFAALESNDSFNPVGDNYWHLSDKGA